MTRLVLSSLAAIVLVVGVITVFDEFRKLQKRVNFLEQQTEYIFKHHIHMTDPEVRQ